MQCFSLIRRSEYIILIFLHSQALLCIEIIESTWDTKFHWDAMLIVVHVSKLYWNLASRKCFNILNICLHQNCIASLKVLIQTIDLRKSSWFFLHCMYEVVQIERTFVPDYRICNERETYLNAMKFLRVFRNDVIILHNIGWKPCIYDVFKGKGKRKSGVFRNCGFLWWEVNISGHECFSSTHEG